MTYWSNWFRQFGGPPLPGNERSDRRQLSRPLRFYSVASLVAMFIAAMFSTLFIRKVAVEDLIEFSERNNLTIAQMAQNGVKTELFRFLATVENIKPGETVNVKPSDAFTSGIEQVLRNTAVVGVKLFNRRGAVVFSTPHEHTGEDHDEYGEFLSAITGTVTSVLISRGTVNRVPQVIGDGSLISTYIPIRGSPDEATPGVFEIYTDATSLVIRNERTEFMILLGVGLILGFLYVMLHLIVRRTSNVIDFQRQAVRERTATLEMLSAHLLTVEECDKKKIATELHEGLAQTLCTLKMVLASSLEGKSKRGRALDTMEKILPALHSAIQEVQDIAQGLRPSSLDTLGLLPTIEHFVRSFECTNPEIRVEHSIALQEGNIPTPLKLVVFRVVEGVFRILASEASSDRIALDLRLVDEKIALEIVDNLNYLAQTALQTTGESSLKQRFAKLHEQTNLSGGIFSVRWNAVVGVTIRAEWPSFSGADLVVNAASSFDDGKKG